MLEDMLLQLFVLSLNINIVLTIISFVLIIALAIVIYKKKHISARQ